MPKENSSPRTEPAGRAARFAGLCALACCYTLLAGAAQGPVRGNLPASSPCTSAIEQQSVCQAGNNEAIRLLSARKLAGVVMMQDVRTGATTVLAGTASDPGGGVRAESVTPDSPLLPLSTVKLMIAASWREHEDSNPQLRNSAPNLDEMLVEGHDAPGRQLALLLRHTLGSEAVLADLARFGFPQCTQAVPDQPYAAPACVALSAKSSDDDWASSLSIGETSITISLAQLSRFLRTVGMEGRLLQAVVPSRNRSTDKMMSPATATYLESAMLGAVDRGTAKGIRGRLGEKWSIGGKTGTGPGNTGDTLPYDGIFAGLVFAEPGKPVCTVVCYVRHGGLGGGAAAEIAADVAKFTLGL